MTKNVIIEDANNVKHAFCPRCGGRWKDSSNGISCEKYVENYFGSNYCIQAFKGIQSNNVIRVFTLILLYKKRVYQLSWLFGFCEFREKVNESWTQPTRLPVLPYTITIEKLKMYVTFT